MKERRPSDITWNQQKAENRAWNVAHADGVFVQGIYRDRGQPRHSIDNLHKPVVIFERKI